MDAIPEKLAAVYLHGSLAMGSFYPPKSDIDLLVISKSSLTRSEQEQIHKRLVNLNSKRKITGSLEMSVVLADRATAPTHPMPYELHYEDELSESITNGEFNYDRAKGHDRDLAAHLTVARNRGISLYGPEPGKLLGSIPWSDFLDAVLDDRNWILDEENILISPFYGVLNCCRVIELLEKGEGTVSSKEEAALWALSYLPSEHHEVIDFALECYRSKKHVSPEERQTGGVDWPRDKLLNFRDYARSVTDKALAF